MTRDADATRSRLLASARHEFAQYGIAGARVDRIAADAGSNKAQIYHYFGSKDALFDAVFADVVQQVVEGIPLDPQDLPGYAERLCRGYDDYPDIMRLATWHRLERGASRQVKSALDSNRAKIAELASVQASGGLSRQIDAGPLLALVLQISAMWVELPDELAAAIGRTSADSRAAVVRQAVSALLEL